MRLRVSTAVLLGLTFTAGGLYAADLGSYPDLFPERPCQDGWAGCVVDGVEVDPGVLRDAAGRPLASDMRIGWFDLQATPQTSPFAPLSDYTDRSVAVAAARPSATRDPAMERKMSSGPEANRDATRGGETASRDASRGASRDASRGGSDASQTASRDASRGGSTVDASQTASRDTSRGGSDASQTASRDTSRDGSTVDAQTTGRDAGRDVGRDASRDPYTSTNEESPAVVEVETYSNEVRTPDFQEVNENPDPPYEEIPSLASVDAVVEVEQLDDSCDDLVDLEPSALMGRLRVGQVECLEGRYSSAGSQTDKDKISRVLIVNAEASGDRKSWESLVKRHLEEVSQSDPDLCFSYARYLSQGGVSRAWGVIKYADVALENKSQWSGSTFKSRVYSLYQLRAEAASRLWEAAAEDVVNGTGDREALQAEEEKRRNMAKNYALEWLDYARASDQETKKPMAICVSAAGSKKFCNE